MSVSVRATISCVVCKAVLSIVGVDQVNASNIRRVAREYYGWSTTTGAERCLIDRSRTPRFHAMESGKATGWLATWAQCSVCGAFDNPEKPARAQHREELIKRNAGNLQRQHAIEIRWRDLD